MRWVMKWLNHHMVSQRHVQQPTVQALKKREDIFSSNMIKMVTVKKKKSLPALAHNTYFRTEACSLLLN
jgi:hypothetical protein